MENSTLKLDEYKEGRDILRYLGDAYSTVVCIRPSILQPNAYYSDHEYLSFLQNQVPSNDITANILQANDCPFKLLQYICHKRLSIRY